MWLIETKVHDMYKGKPASLCAHLNLTIDSLPAQGVVSDANAFAMGGISGHAGEYLWCTILSRIATVSFRHWVSF